MTTEQLSAAVYEKMLAEQQDFRKTLLGMKAEDILKAMITMQMRYQNGVQTSRFQAHLTHLQLYPFATINQERFITQFQNLPCWGILKCRHRTTATQYG